MLDHHRKRHPSRLVCLAALLCAASLVAIGCNDDNDLVTTAPTPSPVPSPSPTPSPAPSPNSGDKVGDVSDNHAHVAIITAAQLAAGDAIELNIQGTAPHNHSFRIDRIDMAMIKDGTRISYETPPGGNGHTHDVTFN
jgi:hypothetical protein